MNRDNRECFSSSFCLRRRKYPVIWRSQGYILTQTWSIPDWSGRDDKKKPIPTWDMKKCPNIWKIDLMGYMSFSNKERAIIGPDLVLVSPNAKASLLRRISVRSRVEALIQSSSEMCVSIENDRTRISSKCFWINHLDRTNYSYRSSDGCVSHWNLSNYHDLRWFHG